MDDGRVADTDLNIMDCYTQSRPGKNLEASFLVFGPDMAALFNVGQLGLLPGEIDKINIAPKAALKSMAPNSIKNWLHRYGK